MLIGTRQRKSEIDSTPGPRGAFIALAAIALLSLSTQAATGQKVSTTASGNQATQKTGQVEGAPQHSGISQTAVGKAGRIARQTHRSNVCCTFVSLDLTHGVVTARETATGKTFQFKVADATLLRRLRPGVSFGLQPALGALRSGQRFSLSLAAPAASLQPHKAEDCCNLLSPISGPQILSRSASPALGGSNGSQAGERIAREPRRASQAAEPGTGGGVAGLEPGGPGDLPTRKICPAGFLLCPPDRSRKQICVRKLKECPGKPPSLGPKGEKCPLDQVWCLPQEKCIDWDELCKPRVEVPEYGNTYEPSSQSAARPSGGSRGLPDNRLLWPPSARSRPVPTARPPGQAVRPVVTDPPMVPATARKVIVTRAVDPCRIASQEQLEPFVAASLAASFPLTLEKGGTSIRLTDPSLHGLTCPRLAVSVRAAVRARVAGWLGSITKHGVVRFRSPVEARVRYLGTKPTIANKFSPAPPPESAADVLEAQLCLTDIEVTGLDLQGVPNWLDSTLIRDCMNGNLPGWSGCRDIAQEMCRDITGLVKVYVAQGGSF